MNPGLHLSFIQRQFSIVNHQYRMVHYEKICNGIYALYYDITPLGSKPYVKFIIRNKEPIEMVLVEKETMLCKLNNNLKFGGF